MSAKPKTGRVTDEEAAQMLADYQRLRSLPKAAALHGRTFQSLYSLLKYRGLITKTKERALPPEKVEAMYADYLRLRSLEKTARKHGRTRQAVWDILRRRFKLLPIYPRRHEVVEHGGVKYTPGRRGDGRGGPYLRATTGDRETLHAVIWREANGPVPDGHELTFADGNSLNCALENLVCLPKKEMRQRNASGTNQHTRSREAELVAGIEGWILKLAQRSAHSFRVDDVDGLAQAGRIAALKAARKWRPDGGAKFITWATMPVKGAIHRAAKEATNIVHVPDAKFFTAGISQVSMDAPVGEDGDGETFGNLFVSEDEGVTAAAIGAERGAALRVMLSRLPKREREILRLRFFEEKTLEEIGEVFRVSRERIRQIEAAVLAKLRRSRNLKRLEAA